MVDSSVRADHQLLNAVATALFRRTDGDQEGHRDTLRAFESRGEADHCLVTHHLGSFRRGSDCRWIRKCRQTSSAVAGSMVARTSYTASTGKPPQRPCSRMMPSSVAW